MTSVTISFDELATFRDQPPPSSSNALHLRLALNIRASPVAEVKKIGPFLEQLQVHMSNILHQPVLFDLKFCKNYYRYAEVASGSSDFQSLGAIAYWRARELSTNVLAAVQEIAGKEAVIVVRSDSHIQNQKLIDLKDHSFAFPDTNATIGLAVMMEMKKAGIRGTNLTDIQVFGDLVPIGDTNIVTGVSDGCNVPPGAGSGVVAALRVRLGSRFETNDFPAPPSFIGKLCARKEAVSDFIWSQLATDTQQQLTESNSTPPSPELLEALVVDLNRILTNALYDSQRFAGVTLSTETRRFVPLNPKGDDLVRFNRLLLQDAFPHELVSRRQMDAAVLQKAYFDKMRRNSGLREIFTIRSIPNVFAANGVLGPAVIDAFQRAVLKLNGEQELLRGFYPREQGFKLPDFAELARVRNALTNEAREFEERKPSPATD